MTPGTNGFLPLARTLPESNVWEMGALAVQIWVWLLIKAIYAPEGYTMNNGIHLRRGQLWTTFPAIRKAMRFRRGRGYSYPPLSTIKATMGQLKDGRIVGWIDARKADRIDGRKDGCEGIVLTVCNYEKYNPLKSESWPNSRPHSCPNSRPVDNSKDGSEEQGLEKDVLRTPLPSSPQLNAYRFEGEENLLILKFAQQPDAHWLNRLKPSPFHYDPETRIWTAVDSPYARDLFDQAQADFGDQVDALELAPDKAEAFIAQFTQEIA